MNELKKALERERKSNDSLRCTGELCRKECAILKTNIRDDALIRAEGIPSQPSLRTWLKSILRRKDGRMGAVLKLKHREQNRPRLEIVQNTLPVGLSNYVYIVFKVSAEIAELFVSDACPTFWSHVAALKTWCPNEKTQIFR